MRVFISEDPFVDMSKTFFERGLWPAQWIGHPELHADESQVVAYRKRLRLGSKTKVRFHVTADERYELYLDGKYICRGSERGDRENWFYESYELELDQGDHVLVARVWWLGPEPPAPYAQISIRPGFLLAAEGFEPEFMNTGNAEWECKKLGGYSWVNPEMTWGTGAKVHIRGEEFDWGFETGGGDGWVAAKAVGPARTAKYANEHPPVWRLKPATLPAMFEETKRVGEARHVQEVSSEELREVPVLAAENLSSEMDGWNRLLKEGSPLNIPANTMRRIIIDLGNYYTAFPELIVSGGKGAKVRILWMEALYIAPDKWVKDNRNDIEGRYFVGIGDTFELDGGNNRRFSTLWWEAGRYLEVFVSTADEPLTIQSLAIRETHYPYEFESTFTASDPRLAEVIPIAFRTLEMCSHETYMDCPYYEQLMYVGDTRLEVLTTYAITHDDRLPVKALNMFDASRRLNGLTQSRYPSRVTQVIPPFSLWWVGMVHDYWMWRDDLALIKQMMPGVRTVLDAFKGWVNAEGLVDNIDAWAYMDWVPDWSLGIPPGGERGISGIISWQMALISKQAAELEEAFGEPEMAERDRKLAERISRALHEKFWDESRGLFTDNLEKTSFSEHAQCLALLSGLVDESKRERIIQGLLNAPDLHRTTIYFTHYLFETYRMIGRMDRFFERMELWFGLKGQGFKTTFESPEPSRSDCHAWAAHPIFHYFASVLGIRPDAPGFAKVKIEPQLGALEWAKVKFPHSKGFISVDLQQKDGKLSGTVELPEGLSGTLVANGSEKQLQPGKQDI